MNHKDEEYILETTGGPKKVFRQRRRRNPFYQKPRIKGSTKINDRWYLALVIELTKARKEQRLTQAALAKKLKTKQSAVSAFEQQLTNPSLAFLARYVKALGKNILFTLK